MALSVGSYDATLTIAEFKGLMQFDENESINTDMRYAADGENIDSRSGSLLPLAVPVATTPTIPCVTGGAGALIRAPYASDTFPTSFGLGHDIIVAGGTQALSGSSTRNIVYLFTPGKSGYIRLPSSDVDPSWTHIDSIDLLSTRWSFAQYQKTVLSHPCDYLLHSNTKFGLSYFYLPADSTGGSWGFSYDSQTPLAPYKFGVIARYGERIWGAGIEGEADLIVYSAPYDPLDWEQNEDIPSAGAGEIRQPTFDGENFTALVPFGNSLLAFKEHSLWRITGLTPDEFNFQEQYGTGTIYPNTIVVYQEAVYFLTDRGICRYDGVAVRPFQTYALRTLWRDHPLSGIDTLMPTATVWHDKYILSYPTSPTATYNTEAIVYDFAEGTWVRGDKSLAATAYVQIHDSLYLLQPTTTGDTKLTEWHGSVEETPTAELSNITAFDGFDWVTPWTDMNCKNILKSHFQIRFWIQTHTDLLSTGANAGKLKLEVTVETERHSKTREMIFDEDVDTPILMRFNAYGKRARFKFKCRDADGNVRMNCWCKIMGGVQINADVAAE